MSDTLVMRGRGIVAGTVEAEALVTRDPISGFGGIDVATGTVIEPRHELFGVCFTGKVLVFPGAKGSSGWSGFFQSTRLMGTAPAAMVFDVVTTKAVLGAIVTRVPTVVEASPPPLDIIRTGDRVRVDGDTGLVTVLERALSTYGAPGISSSKKLRFPIGIVSTDSAEPFARRGRINPTQESK